MGQDPKFVTSEVGSKSTTQEKVMMSELAYCPATNYRWIPIITDRIKMDISWQTVTAESCR